MRILKKITGQPFVFATGLAALIHSTWSLGVLFAGTEPEQYTFAWVAWLAPALLIAFALDVGQIVTSAEIRAGERTRAKYATFTVLAVSTYFLQWLYVVHHMPALDLAPGVRAEWIGAATLLRDAALWFLPALLPLSTLLYTLSHPQKKNGHNPRRQSPKLRRLRRQWSSTVFYHRCPLMKVLSAGIAELSTLPTDPSKSTALANLIRAALVTNEQVDFAARMAAIEAALKAKGLL